MQCWFSLNSLHSLVSLKWKLRNISDFGFYPENVPPTLLLHTFRFHPIYCSLKIFKDQFKWEKIAFYGGTGQANNRNDTPLLIILKSKFWIISTAISIHKIIRSLFGSQRLWNHRSKQAGHWNFLYDILEHWLTFLDFQWTSHSESRSSWTVTDQNPVSSFWPPWRGWPRTLCSIHFVLCLLSLSRHRSTLMDIKVM